MPERLVVIGGDPGGMTAVSQVRRANPEWEIVALERGRWTSYSACGIPYLVGGEISDIDQLVARTPQQFRDRDHIDVRMGHEVTGIDLDARRVEVRDLEHERTYRLDFDQLLIGTGGAPIRPELPGIDLDVVHGVQNLHDAADLLQHAEAVKCERVVVVGGGYIGLEMAEAFIRRGMQVALVDRNKEVMGTLDTDMGALVTAALRRQGVDVHTGTEVDGFEEHQVLTSDGPLPADLIVLGIGVLPNSELAGAAGIELGVKGAIRVNRRQRTSVDGVWAAGDCCESHHLVSGEQVHIPLGTVANKQSRVAGINIGGGYATFPGVLGTAISKICDTEVSRTGLTTVEAERAGFAAVAATITTTTVAGYLAEAEKMQVKVVAERNSGRLLGAQIVGGKGSAKRVDTFAMALTAQMDVRDILNVDLSYAPPFSGVWDPVLVAAREVAKLV